MAAERDRLVYMVSSPAVLSRDFLVGPRQPCRPPFCRLCSLQAKLAEEAERYEDMVQNVKSLAELNVQLNVEVRQSLRELRSVGWRARCRAPAPSPTAARIPARCLARSHC